MSVEACCFNPEAPDVGLGVAGRFCAPTGTGDKLERDGLRNYQSLETEVHIEWHNKFANGRSSRFDLGEMGNKRDEDGFQAEKREG